MQRIISLMKYSATCLLLGLMFSCGQTDAAPENRTDAAAGSTGSVAGTNALTTVEWIDPKKDLGTINEGQKLQIRFSLKNTGTAPLVLQSVTPGCGCTLAEYPREPIAPGKEAEIIASFDSQGREGQQQKQITVIANTKESKQHVLSFSVMVRKAKTAS